MGRCVALQVKRVVEDEAAVEGRLLGRSAVGSLAIFLSVFSGGRGIFSVLSLLPAPDGSIARAACCLPP